MGGSNEGGVPGYASMLAAYHEAFAAELEAIVAALPISGGHRVLDLACGDGSYARWLADRVGPNGEVVGVDLSEEYLRESRSNLEGNPRADRIRLVVAPLDRLPFADGSFDLVWCAQSLFSLPDPVEALRIARRMARPGGIVAVLETDTLHQVLLPWPIEVELAVRAAELVGLAEDSDRPRKFYVGRGLLPIFRDAGLEATGRRTFATDRRAPLGPAERAFLESYLRELRDQARPHLEPEVRAKFDRLADERSADYLLDGPDFALTMIDHLAWGRRPIA